MSDSNITLNLATIAGGAKVDAELISTVERQRVQLGGAALADIVTVAATTPAPTDKALNVVLSPNSAPLQTKEVTSTTSTVARKTSSGVTQTLFLLNTLRLLYHVQNDPDSGDTLFVKEGASASSTNYTRALFPGGSYEPPVNYTGLVTIIWGPDGGSCNGTEYT